MMTASVDDRSRVTRRVERTPGVSPGARLAWRSITAAADQGRTLGAADLAAEHGVTERTAFRWLAELRRLGAWPSS